MKVLFLSDQQPPSEKLIINEDAVIFFPATQQHRDVKLLGLNDEEDCGNCVAGIILVCRIDIRFHKEFSDERIRSLWRLLKAEPQLSFLLDWQLFYRGQEIT